MVTQELEEAIDGGTIDCGIQAIPASHTGLSALELMKDDFLLMAPLEHPLLQHPSLALASLDPAQLVLLAEGHCLRDQALALCKASGGQCSKVVAGSLELLRTLVAAGHGYSLMPRLAAENSGFANPLLGFAEFSDPVPSRTLGLVFRKTTYRIDEFKAFAEVAATCKF
jgi:LysR family hydrogen peroxide-inducible transcriptional activator